MSNETNKTIFIQIASYRDGQLPVTLLDLIENADNKDNLRITVAWQHGPDQNIENTFLNNGFAPMGNAKSLTKTKDKDDVVHLFEKDGALLKIIDIHYLETNGACWARNKIQQYYDNERYTMQLDSHHRFIEHWDTVLIEMLESVRDVSPKPLLTGYIASFDPANDPAARINEAWKMDFDRFIPEGAVFFRPSTIDDWRTRTRPMLSRFYSAHFAFADGKFAVEVQHDPEYFFHGEEISIGVRAFTHGYDLYHPNKPVVWHEYTRKGRIKVWDDHTTTQKNKGKINLDWVERNNLCHKRNRILFGMDGEDPSQIDFGKYGFGTARTLKDYEEYSGLSFKHRSVQKCVMDRTEPSLTWKKYDNEEEWVNSLTRSNDVRILLHVNEVKDEHGNLPTDFDFWYVGIHDKDQKEIHRKDLTKDEIYSYLKDREIVDYQYIWMGDVNDKAVYYIIWPHSESLGWMNRIVKTI